MYLDVINTAVGMEVEIHLDRAGDPGAILDLFAPSNANCSEETGIVITITRQSHIQSGGTGSSSADVVRIHFTTAKTGLGLLE